MWPLGRVEQGRRVEDCLEVLVVPVVCVCDVQQEGGEGVSERGGVAVLLLCYYAALFALLQ